LSDNVVWTVLPDRNGVVWVGTRNGLNALDRSKAQTHRYYNESKRPESLSSSYVWTLTEGRADDLWVGTYAHGLNRLDRRTGRIRRISLGPGEGAKSENAVRALRFDRAGQLWIGTNGGGLLRLNPDTGALAAFRMDLHDTASLSADEVWSIVESRDGSLWVGTDGGGLNHFDPITGRVRRFRHQPTDHESLGGDRVWSLHESGDGTLWIGIKDGGLSRLDPLTGKIRRFTEENSDLPNDTVYGIVEDAAGRLWLSTNQGLSCFDPVAEMFTNFDVGHGLQSNEFNLGAYGRGRDGELFFGGIDGLNYFFPAEVLSSSKKPPPVAITGFSKFGTPVREELRTGEEIRLSYRENFFSFSFSVLDFENPRSNRYEYKLDGVDADWKTTDAANRNASYTFVPPGKYVFHVRGANSRGVRNRDGTFVALIIPPPFYKRVWFLTLAGLLATGAILGCALYWLHRRNKIRRMMVEGRERERVELAGEIHDGPLHALMTQLHGIDALYKARHDVSFLEGLPGRLQQMRWGLVEICDSLRNVCSTLRPPTLDRFGLDFAIRDYFNRLAEASPMPEPIFELQHAEGLLPEHVQAQLFRIYQSLLNNVARHARARTVWIRLQVSRKRAVLEVHDDGVGFRPRKLLDLAEARHYGLFTAEERARSLGGDLHPSARPDQGTSVCVEIPLGSRLSELSGRWKRWRKHRHESNPTSAGG
jgi:streptogramin lyase